MSINKRAIFSGALGATASFIAKLALAPDSPVTSAVHNICTTKVHVVVEQIINNDIPPWFCPTVSLASRGICLLFMIGMNAFMISTFLDGMDESGSVVGTALSTAANFCCSVSFYIESSPCAKDLWSKICIVCLTNPDGCIYSIFCQRQCMGLYSSARSYHQLGVWVRH